MSTPELPERLLRSGRSELPLGGLDKRASATSAPLPWGRLGYAAAVALAAHGSRGRQNGEAMERDHMAQQIHDAETFDQMMRIRQSMRRHRVPMLLHSNAMIPQGPGPAMDAVGPHEMSGDYMPLGYDEGMVRTAAAIGADMAKRAGLVTPIALGLGKAVAGAGRAVQGAVQGVQAAGVSRAAAGLEARVARGVAKEKGLATNYFKNKAVAGELRQAGVGDIVANRFAPSAAQTTAAKNAVTARAERMAQGRAQRQQYPLGQPKEPGVAGQPFELPPLPPAKGTAAPVGQVQSPPATNALATNTTPATPGTPAVAPAPAGEPSQIGKAWGRVKDVYNKGQMGRAALGVGAVGLAGAGIYGAARAAGNVMEAPGPAHAHPQQYGRGAPPVPYAVGPYGEPTYG